MIYRCLKGRRQAGRCDACGATDGTVLECWFPYSDAAAIRYDEHRSIAPGSGQFWDLCQDCRKRADTIRQRFTDDRGVRTLLRECCRPGTGNAQLGGLAAPLAQQCLPPSEGRRGAAFVPAKTAPRHVSAARVGQAALAF